MKIFKYIFFMLFLYFSICVMFTWNIRELKIITKNYIAYQLKDYKNDNYILNQKSRLGYNYYSQGGVTFNNYAYFTGSKYTNNQNYKKSEDFSYVVKFELTPPFKKIKTYNFEDTYDSSPLFLKSEPNLIIAHEYRKNRTKAINENTGKVEWTSNQNQIGALFFGYNIVNDLTGNTYILGGFENGLSILNSKNGKQKKFIKRISSGGVTPAVNNDNGDIFYQYDGGLLKFNINSNKIIKEIQINTPNKSICWNTILTNDDYGQFIVTYWIGDNGFLDSSIRVYDYNLNLIWEKSDLPGGKKNTLTYFKGKVILGIGNTWNKNYNNINYWKKIPFFNVKNGEILFSSDLTSYNFESIPNLPVVNDWVFAETQNSKKDFLLVINGNNGEIIKVHEFKNNNTSCAPSIISGSYFLSGDINEDQINITKILENSDLNWEGPFGSLFTNSNSLNGYNIKLLDQIETLN